MGRQARREVPRCLQQRRQLGSFDRDRGLLGHDATSDQPFGPPMSRALSMPNAATTRDPLR
jgi:hypothetical protein